MEKYKSLISSINKEICSFNNFLADDYKISILHEEDLDNPNSFGNLIKTSWDDLRFVNSEKRGVYFIFGYHIDTKETGVYIGKASLSSKIGRRLYDHLQSYRNEEYYLMNDRNGKEFVLELLTSISFEENSAMFFSPALEEFLIINLKNKVKLLNIKGNRLLD